MLRIRHEKVLFLRIVILMWLMILNALFTYDYIVDIQRDDCVSYEGDLDGYTPFTCSQDFLLSELTFSIFWGIIGTVILSKLITIDDDEEE